MIMHHGAGYSALSFACLAKELDGLIGKDVGVLAFDARKHGKCSVIPCSFHKWDPRILQERPSQWTANRMKIYRWTYW